MPNPEQMNPDQLARACADSMWAQDTASKGLGMRLDAVGAGRATVSMRVREDMCNGHGSCQGGFIFTLADSAFAYACNGYNQFTVAAGCSISYILPAQVGDVLIATGIERNRSARSGIYDITVRRENGDVVAEFRGNSRTVKGQHLPTGE